MRIAIAIAAIMLAFQVHQDARGQIAVSGIVVADDTGEVLPGVTVVIEGTFIGTVTDRNGAYFIDLRTLKDVLVFSIVGFRTRRYSLSPGVTTLDVRMETSVARLEEISVVAEETRTFASNVVAEPMKYQHSNITNVTSVVDNLPGVSIQEGDAYGFDDWSSNIAMRGFQVTISEAQIGTTIDGFPNGTSDYFSGAKANRFVDPTNLRTVEVSQGTADIASRSVEALGGTFNYQTNDPAEERTYTASATIGEYEGKRFHMRIDTGPFSGGQARAWIAAIRQESTDWVEGSARNEREHVAAKLALSHGRVEVTSYLSYDNIYENNFQRIYSEADFRASPRSDRLIGEWPGVPYLNQFYRPGWETRRSNTLAYLKAELPLKGGTSLSAGAYVHRHRGRGDWLPPYVVDITDDGAGPESELTGTTPVRGGTQLGLIRFVNTGGVAVGPTPGCSSSYIFNYYGSGGAEVDPACHPGATAVQSYRHSHYGKDRIGLTLDEEWFADVGAAVSKLRTGLWYERSRRDLGRDWHQILDPTVSFAWNQQAYWHQYEWDFPQHVFRWYVEETFYAGPFALSGGLKQFLVRVSRIDLFGVDADLEANSDSKLLASGGVTYETPVEGLHLFAGYAQNFKAISSTLLEVPGRSLDALEPESASNIDVGLQYTGKWIALGATGYFIDFQNRIVYLGPQTPAGPNYLIPGGGAYFNAGGIRTSGLELSATVQLPQHMSLYTTLTSNNSEYLGSGDPLVDASQNIIAGADVTGVPERLWVISLDRVAPLRMGLTVKYTSPRRVSLTADWYADAYWLADAYVGFSAEALGHVFRSTEFSIVANNLFDQAYLSAITENAAWLGAPRSISMTATVSF